MKKKAMIALCAGGSLAIPAYAQSNVTVFGLLDLRVSHITNDGGGSVTSLNHSGIGPSRLGFRGTEDLGDGLYAGFHLEGQVKPNSGESNARFWNRRSTVSLGSQSWGELRLGRDVSPSYRITTRFDPFTANGIGAGINLLSAGPNANNGPSALRIKTFNQTDNAIGYFLPGDDGNAGSGNFYGQWMSALGGGTGDKYSGAHLGWKNTVVNLAGHVAQTRPAAGTVVKYRTAGLAASYELFKGTTVMAQYQQERSNRARAVDYEEKWWLLGAVHRVGVSEFRASYARRNSIGNKTESANDASLWALGYVHHLSKRTALYATYARMDNAGTGTYFIPNGPTTIAPGGSSRGLDLGVRHHF